jgi:hypothetical protein
VRGSIRFECSVTEELADRLRLPIEQATETCAAACDVFVYSVSPAPSVMVRVTVGQAVLPLLLHEHDLEPNRVLAALKGALASAQY